ncbi:Dicer-like protein 1, partial [Rhizophlyctis rosea]
MNTQPKNPPYYLRILSDAKQNNIVTFLPSKPARTLAFSSLIHSFYSTENNVTIQSPHSEVAESGNSIRDGLGPRSGRRIGVVVMLTDTPSIQRQAAELKSATDFAIGEYSSFETCALDENFWRNELKSKDVLILSHDMFATVISQSFISLSDDVGVLVIDQVDRYEVEAGAHQDSSGNDLTKLIELHQTSADQRPRIVGLTADPIYDDDVNKYSTWKQHLNCKIITVDGRTRASKDFVIEYNHASAKPIDTLCERFYNHYHDAIRDSESVTDSGVCDGLAEIEYLRAELGNWCAGRLAEYIWTEQQKTGTKRKQPTVLSPSAKRPKTDSPATNSSTSSSDRILHAPQMKEVTALDLTPKVLTLLRILEERFKCWAGGDVNRLRVVVIVRKRTAAHVLTQLMNGVAPARFPVVRAACEFVGPADGSNGHVNANTLVVSVAEFANAPHCELAILFDFRPSDGHTPHSVLALSGKHFRERIIFVEKGNAEAMLSLASYTVNETKQQTDPASDNDYGIIRYRQGQLDETISSVLVDSAHSPLVSRTGTTLLPRNAPAVLNRYIASAYGSDATLDSEVVISPGVDDASIWKDYISARKTQTIDDDPKSKKPDIPSQLAIARLEREKGFKASYAVRIRLPPAGPHLAKEVYGSLRATEKLAREDACFEVCRWLRRIGVLNDHFLPVVKGGERGGSSLVIQQLLRNWGKRNANSEDLEGRTRRERREDVSEVDETLMEYRRRVPRVFRRDGIWERVLGEVGESVPRPIVQVSVQLFVTVLSFGPQLEVFTRGCDPPISAFHDLQRPPLFPEPPSPYTNHYYHFPNPNSFALSTGEPRRTVAVLTTRPVPAK